MSVSESERDRTVKALTRHCGDGRLTLEELEQRIELAFEAQTTAELHELVRDLPKDDLLAVTGVVPSPALQPHPSPTTPARPARPSNLVLTPQARKAGEIALRVHLVVYLSIIGMLSMIWLLSTGTSAPFWPIWVAMPWGAALAIHAGVHKAVWAGRDDV